MMKLRQTLFVEPGEVELLALAAREQGRRWSKRRGSEVARGLILLQVGEELARFLQVPAPPVYAIAPASKGQAREVARLLAGLAAATLDEVSGDSPHDVERLAQAVPQPAGGPKGRPDATKSSGSGT